jgi:hypothetical protein
VLLVLSVVMSILLLVPINSRVATWSREGVPADWKQQVRRCDRFQPLTGIYDPSGTGRVLFAFFAAMAETERENIREATLEGLNAAARKGNHGGRPPVITEDMLHTVLRRRARGESVEDIRPDLIIPTGKRKGQRPSLASIYRALAEHDKRQRYPEAVEQAPHRPRRPPDPHLTSIYTRPRHVSGVFRSRAANTH